MTFTPVGGTVGVPEHVLEAAFRRTLAADKAAGKLAGSLPAAYAMRDPSVRWALSRVTGMVGYWQPLSRCRYTNTPVYGPVYGPATRYLWHRPHPDTPVRLIRAPVPERLRDALSELARIHGTTDALRAMLEDAGEDPGRLTRVYTAALDTATAKQALKEAQEQP